MIGISLIQLGLRSARAEGSADDRSSRSIDAGFDRISLQIEPLIGMSDDVRELFTESRRRNGALVAGDVIPLTPRLGYRISVLPR